MDDSAYLGPLSSHEALTSLMCAEHDCVVNTFRMTGQARNKKQQKMCFCAVICSEFTRKIFTLKAKAAIASIADHILKYILFKFRVKKCFEL